MDRVGIREASQVGDARRRAVAIAQAIGFDEAAAGRVAIAVTELATNIVKYGVPGEILLGTYEDRTGVGVEILALDKGPGIRDAADALRDGHSTGGSAGTGLGAVRRLSDAFDIVSRPGTGTAVLARLSSSRPAAKAPTAKRPADTLPVSGAVTVALDGEIANGDAYAIRERADGWSAMVADGLGHGPEAAKASEEAVRIFLRHRDEPPAAILSAVHAGLRHTRGGAVSVARFARGAGVLAFAGIGNVAGAVVRGDEARRAVTLAGTAGHAARRIQEFEYPMGPDDLFLLCSDGIASGFSLDGYPGLAEAHPTLVAGVLYRDFARPRDDATALVVRGGEP